MKKFLIIGNSNAITYKSIFPHIASGEWFLRTGKGDRHCSMYFLDEDGERKDMPSLWYTNLDSRHLYQELELTEKYDPEKYPKYDNFDGIEVSKLRDIPYDYEVEKIVTEKELKKLKEQGFDIEIIEEYCN